MAYMAHLDRLSVRTFIRGAILVVGMLSVARYLGAMLGNVKGLSSSCLHGLVIYSIEVYTRGYSCRPCSWQYLSSILMVQIDPAGPSLVLVCEGAMAYIKEAEGFLAKLPSISLEGMDPLAPHALPKEQVHTVETEDYKVRLAATCTLMLGEARRGHPCIYRAAFSKNQDSCPILIFIF